MSWSAAGATFWMHAPAGWPLLSPRVHRGRGAVRDDVEVAVLEEASEILGFFPYQCSRWNVAHPVGGRLSHYQGIIADPEVYWLPGEILAACKLSAWDFDRQLAWQSQLAPYFSSRATSPVIDLSRLRVMAREPLGGQPAAESLPQWQRLSQSSEFAWHSTDAAIFGGFWLGIPRSQRVSGSTASLASRGSSRSSSCSGWPKDRGLRGFLSTLRVDGRVLAVHFGLRSDETLHSWCVACDPDLAPLFRTAGAAAADRRTRCRPGSAAD